MRRRVEGRGEGTAVCGAPDDLLVMLHNLSSAGTHNLDSIPSFSNITKGLRTAQPLKGLQL